MNAKDLRVRVGDYVEPDTWRVGNYLTASDWEKAEFRLPGLAPVAVNIKVTGRKVREYNHAGDARVRVSIEFVGDGESSVSVGGWAWLKEKK